MAKDTLKSRIRFSTTLSFDTEKALKDYSAKSMISISRIVDAAIKEYIAKRKTL